MLIKMPAERLRCRQRTRPAAARGGSASQQRAGHQCCFRSDFPGLLEMLLRTRLTIQKSSAATCAATSTAMTGPSPSQSNPDPLPCRGPLRRPVLPLPTMLRGRALYAGCWLFAAAPIAAQSVDRCLVPTDAPQGLNARAAVPAQQAKKDRPASLRLLLFSRLDTAQTTLR